ncbi:ATP-binding protein [Candidatus Parcubacteria bacterium]|nr:ATP-binding protein [Candidatus Parcubacteria bacterium]
MRELIEKYARLLSHKKEIYSRNIFNDFVLDGRIIGVVGPRGVGKTTFLLEYAKKNYQNSKKALYISADDPYFLNNTLIDCAQSFINDYDGELMFIDEIHRYKNWNQELKNIYDFFPGLKIIFSGSSSINLIKGKYDLSRRAIIYHLNGFSFREFLEYKLKIKLKNYTIDKLIKDNVLISKQLLKIPKILGYFKEYLQIGYYPFAFEFKKIDNIYNATENIINKAIYEDIASFYNLKTENLIIFKKLLFFLATISPGEININKLSNSLQKDNKTIMEYLQILSDAGFIRFLLNNKKGHSFVRSIEKIYIDNTVLLYAINSYLGKQVQIGLAREVFICNQLKNAGCKIFYAKNGDITNDKYTFEIGGKNKNRKQIKDIKNSYLVLDDIIIGGENKIPLYLFGFFY